MIFWQGRGLLVVLSFVIGFLGGRGLQLLDIAAFDQLGSVTLFVAIDSLIAAAANWILTKLFVDKHVNDILDERSGQVVRIKGFGTFMFIRNRSWTPILIVSGIVVFALYFFLK